MIGWKPSIRLVEDSEDEDELWGGKEGEYEYELMGDEGGEDDWVEFLNFFINGDWITNFCTSGPNFPSL